MIEALSAPRAMIDAGLGGVLLANMLEGWLDGEPKVLPTTETADELEDCRTSPKQTCLHLSTPIDAGSSTPPSGEHGAPVCAARDGDDAGLERIPDPHTRPRLGKDGDRNGWARGLQDSGCGCLDGSGGRGVCVGSLATGALEPRLASTAGVVCAHHNPRHRRRWLLRSGGLQRRIVTRVEGDNGPGRVTLFARAPPGRQAQQSQERRVAFPTSSRFLLRR